MYAVIISSPQQILEGKPQMSVWFRQNRIGAIPHARGRRRKSEGSMTVRYRTRLHDWPL